MRSVFFCTLSLMLSACASNTKINGEDMIIGHGNFGYKGTYQEHGYSKPNKDQKVCDGDNNLLSTYYIKPRLPSKGESESLYASYLKAEKRKASICAVVGLWCGSEMSLLCRLDDKSENCMKNRNTCAKKLVSAEDKELFRISTGVTEDFTLTCFSQGTSETSYTSALAWSGYTNKAFKFVPKEIEKLCEGNKSLSECQDILSTAGNGSAFIGNPYDEPRKLVEILLKHVPEVVEKDGYFISTAQLDFTPACIYLENRH